MKSLAGLLLIVTLCYSCDNELIVTDEWKDIPVVWGLLSASDTAHYIRVEKAFLDPTTSALDIARIPDSLYYDDAVVTLRRIASGETFTLTRVDGDLEGYPREGGTFAETPNYLYKITADDLGLTVENEYEFVLRRDDVSPLVTARTIILPKPVLRVPQAGAALPFRANSTFTFQWNEMPDAGLFDVHLRFHYLERSPATGNIYMPRSFLWTVKKNLTNREHKIDGSEFFNAVAANIDEDPTAQRLFESIDIVVWCGGKQLQEFLKVIQANQSITSTQDIPSYTNLSEGIGIFTSRNISENKGFQLTEIALDSLRDGQKTKDLNFN
jgi:hypothetical protein